MRITPELPIEDRELVMGQEMSSISFDELIRELTGVSYSDMFKDFSEYGVKDE